MFLDFYQLANQPFGVTPDPRYLYLGKGHREAMASVMYGVSAGRGFSALIARPGMGKTTLLFNLLKRLEGNAQTVFLFQSQCSPQDLVRSLLADLGVEHQDGGLAGMQAKLNDFLLRESKRGKRFVVVIDEAQNLDGPVLEVLRMLSNFETTREKLMHIVLAGQPQLACKLASPSLTQLRQRVSIIARLSPLNSMETRAYIDHRLRVAGYDFASPLFSDPVYELIARYSEGIPRNINNLCFNVLSLGCALKKRTIRCALLREVVDDLNLNSILEEASPLGSGVPALARKTEENSGYAGAKWFRAWPWKVATVGSLGIALALTAVPKSPRATQAAVKSESPLPVPAPSAETQGSFELVKVQPNQTLYGICRERLGQSNAETMAQILQLNPDIQDPAMILSGASIRVPLHVNASHQIHSLPGQLPHAQAAKLEKP